MSDNVCVRLTLAMLLMMPAAAVAQEINWGNIDAYNAQLLQVQNRMMQDLQRSDAQVRRLQRDAELYGQQWLERQRTAQARESERRRQEDYKRIDDARRVDDQRDTAQRRRYDDLRIQYARERRELEDRRRRDDERRRRDEDDRRRRDEESRRR